MREKLRRLESLIAGRDTCPVCGLPLKGPMVKIIRLAPGEPEPRLCEACGSPTVLLLRTRTVEPSRAR